MGAVVVTAILAVAAFYAVPLGLFPGVSTPRWRPASEIEAELRPDDEVIGLEVAGDARAYPVGWIARPHVVVDDVGGQPVAMTYCLLSHLAVAYRAELDGVPMRPVVMEQLENNLITYDSRTDSLLQQVDCEVSSGPQAGRRLDVLPARIMPWSTWRALHPQSRVFYHPARGPIDRLARRFLGTIGARQFGIAKPAFPTISGFDDRLHPKTQVIGISEGDDHLAVTLAYLAARRVVSDQVGARPVAIVYDPIRDIVDVFDLRLPTGTAMIAVEPEGGGAIARLRDTVSGGSWDVLGRPEGDGPPLERVPHASRILWMVWFNYRPTTRLLADLPETFSAPSQERLKRAVI
jgi:hypothetical protein